MVFNGLLSTWMCICREVIGQAGGNAPVSKDSPSQTSPASSDLPHVPQSCIWRNLLCRDLFFSILFSLHTSQRLIGFIGDFQTFVLKRRAGREQMSSFQQKLALKGSETSIEHFASVLKDVKDRGGWNTASALVKLHQQRIHIACARWPSGVSAT